MRNLASGSLLKVAWLAFGALALIVLIPAGCSSEPSTCRGTDKRVCLIPFGDVSGELVGQLVDHYRDEYDLRVQVLDEESIPEEFVDSERHQVGGIALLEHMGDLFPEAFADPDAVLIGLTPVDMYIEDVDWRFAFWVSNVQSNKGMVSSARMDPENFGLERDDDLRNTRVRKVVTHLIGTLYFSLPQSEDPGSVLYNNVLSLDDLDRMGDDLPADIPR